MFVIRFSLIHNFFCNRNIEELQEQNQRLLATVRQLSEDQEKLEQEGGHEV